MYTGRENICCHENTNSRDKIPPAMSCITDDVNFNAVCTNPAVIETTFNQYLENEGPIDDEPLNEYMFASFLYEHGYISITFFNAVFTILDQHA